MKINLGKLAAIAAQLIVAVPVIISAIKPIVVAIKATKAVSTKK